MTDLLDHLKAALADRHALERELGQDEMASHGAGAQGMDPLCRAAGRSDVSL